MGMFMTLHLAFLHVMCPDNLSRSVYTGLTHVFNCYVLFIKAQFLREVLIPFFIYYIVIFPYY